MLNNAKNHQSATERKQIEHLKHKAELSMADNLKKKVITNNEIEIKIE
jgi:hypothetical protein